MDMTELVNRIQNELGLKNSYVFTKMNPYKIAEYIRDYALPQFSELNQHRTTVKIQFTEDDIIDETNASNILCGSVICNIPEPLQELKRAGYDIFSVGQMIETQSLNRTLGTIYPTVGHVSLLADARAHHAGMSRNRERSVARAKLVGNTLVVENTNIQELQWRAFMLEVSLHHTKNLASITTHLSHTFTEWCIWSIASFIYNNEFKYIDQTELGGLTLDLKIEKFISADDRKRELIEKIRESMQIDMFKSYLV